MRAQARILMPVRLRQEKRRDPGTRFSQLLCVGRGSPDCLESGDPVGMPPTHPQLRWGRDAGIGVANCDGRAVAVRCAVMRTCVSPSVGVDHPLGEGVVRWIDGAAERKLRSALQNPGTDRQALCRARTFRLQGEGICAKQQAEPPRIGRVAWCAGSCRNNTRKTGGSHALTGTPPKSGGTAVRRVPEAGGAACAHAGERTPSSVLFPRHDRRGLLSGNLVRRSGRIPLAESCGLRRGGSWGHPEFGEE